MVRRTSAALAGAGVLVALALVGCSGTTAAPDPSATTSSSGTSTASSTPAASPSPMPTEVAEGTLDQNVLAQAITSNLNDSLGAGVPLTVTCPAGVAVKQGATSTCTAIIDGQTLDFTVTQADDQGNVDFAAAAAVLDLVKLQTQTAQQYGEQKGGTWTASCDATSRSYLVQPVGATFDCTFTSSTGDTQPYTVTVKDLDGNVSWAEK